MFSETVGFIIKFDNTYFSCHKIIESDYNRTCRDNCKCYKASVQCTA